jgi:hypothetical protein
LLTLPLLQAIGSPCLYLTVAGATSQPPASLLLPLQGYAVKQKVVEGKG